MALERVCCLRGHEERVWCVAWRPLADPPQLASCGSDSTVRIWGAKKDAALDSEDTWRLVAEIDTSDRHSRTLRSLTWSPDGSILALACFDSTTSLWREEESQEGGGQRAFTCLNVLSGHENEVKSTAFSPSGEYFASCSRDRSVWIYETDPRSEYECVAVLQSHTQDVKMVRWHPQQDVLFSCSYDDSIKVWGPDGDDWSCRETLQGHDSTVWDMSFNAEGSLFVSCSDDKSLRIWAPVPEASPRAPGSTEVSSCSGTNLAASLKTASFVMPLFRSHALLPLSKESEVVATKSSTDHDVPANAACRWRCVATIQGQHTRPVYSVDWLQFELPDATYSIASACGDNCLRIFQPRDEQNLSGWTCVAQVEAHDGDVNCVAWCPAALPAGGALLASAGDDGELRIWRFRG